MGTLRAVHCRPQARSWSVFKHSTEARTTVALWLISFATIEPRFRMCGAAACLARPSREKATMSQAIGTQESIFDREGLHTTLGIELQELTPERVVATMPVT